jgi:hypothetical protein
LGNVQNIKKPLKNCFVGGPNWKLVDS